MKYLIKQKFFSWFDSFDVTDESGRIIYTVKGRLDWGHNLHFFDAYGNDIASVREKVLTWLPKFELTIGGQNAGWIRREFSWFHPRYQIDLNGWQVEGNFLEWDYQVTGPLNQPIATISKDLWHWTDHYVIDVPDDRNALPVLMLVVAIDAEKCTRAAASNA